MNRLKSWSPGLRSWFIRGPTHLTLLVRHSLTHLRVSFELPNEARTKREHASGIFKKVRSHTGGPMGKSLLDLGCFLTQPGTLYVAQHHELDGVARVRKSLKELLMHLLVKVRAQ